MDYEFQYPESTNRAIGIFNWEKLFQNKDIQDQLKLFNKTLLDIVHSYLPNKHITCNLG